MVFYVAVVTMDWINKSNGGNSEMKQSWIRKYKMVFSDIDGTLLDSEHRISTNTKAFVQHIVNQGIPFILVSARMPSSVEAIAAKLGIRCPIVCYSGGLILDEEKNVISSAGIAARDAVAIKRFIADTFPDVNATFYADDCWMVDSLEDPWVKNEAVIAEVTPVAGKVDSVPETAIVHKLLCMGNQASIGALENILIERFPGFRIYKSKSTYLEIMSKDASKATALKTLCDVRGVNCEDSIAFGDHFNDMDMLEAAGFGVAMQNAPDTVKASADFITKSNDEDGLYLVLKQCFG